jgi:hypothetical protein
MSIKFLKSVPLPTNEKITKPGVYLHTFHKEDHYLVIYVAKADRSIWGRNCEHYNNCFKRKNCAVDIEHSMKVGDLNVVFIPDYDASATESVLITEVLHS